MTIRQSPSGINTGLLGIAARNIVTNDLVGGTTAAAGAGFTPIQAAGPADMIVSYTGQAGKVYQEAVRGSVNALNVAAAGNDTWRVRLERQTTPAGGAASGWSPVSETVIRETAAAGAGDSQGAEIPQTNGFGFAPAVNTLVEFRIVIEAAVSDAFVDINQASLELVVYSAN